MGTHGRSGLAHALLGSVAERVVQHAPCPVLIVPKRPEAGVTPRAWTSARPTPVAQARLRSQRELAQLDDAGAVAALARRARRPARDVGRRSRWARTRLRSAPVPWPWTTTTWVSPDSAARSRNGVERRERLVAVLPAQVERAPGRRRRSSASDPRSAAAASFVGARPRAARARVPPRAPAPSAGRARRRPRRRSARPTRDLGAPAPSGGSTTHAVGAQPLDEHARAGHQRDAPARRASRAPAAAPAPRRRRDPSPRAPPRRRATSPPAARRRTIARSAARASAIAASTASRDVQPQLALAPRQRRRRLRAAPRRWRPRRPPPRRAAPPPSTSAASRASQPRDQRLQPDAGGARQRARPLQQRFGQAHARRDVERVGAPRRADRQPERRPQRLQVVLPCAAFAKRASLSPSAFRLS